MNTPDFLPVLSSGSHKDPSQGACVMEFVSFLAGEPFSDRPKCTHPAFIDIAQRINDRMADGERQKLIPLIPRLWNTSETTWRTDLAMASYVLRRLWSEDKYLDGLLTAKQARDLADAWTVIDGFARYKSTSWVDLMTTAAAAAAATAATATAAAATATATAAAAAAAASVICAMEAISWISTNTDWLLSVLNGAIDVYDEMQNRTPADLVTEQWQSLSCLTSH